MAHVKDLATYIKIDTPLFQLERNLRRSIEKVGYGFERVDESLDSVSSPNAVDFAVIDYVQFLGDHAKCVKNILLFGGGTLHGIVVETLQQYGVPANPIECSEDTKKNFGTNIYYSVFDHFAEPFHKEQMERMY